MYNIGQANNLMTAGSVSLPVYDIGSLENNQYPCDYNLPNTSKRPQSIPLGEFEKTNRAYDMKGYTDQVYQEDYVENTQQKNAGEMSDKFILIIMTSLFLALILCTLLSFKKN